MQRSIKCAALACLILAIALGGRPAKAQVVSFVGTVYRSTGYPLPGLQVGLFSSGTGWIGPSITDSYGRYAFYNTPPGQYLLRITYGGQILYNEAINVPGTHTPIVLP